MQSQKWQNPVHPQNLQTPLMCRLTETQSNQLKPEVDLPTPKCKLIPRMSVLTLAISFLTTSNLPWFMDLTFQVPMQYCSLQHLNLLLSPVPSTTGCFIWFASISFYYARATLFACLRRDLTLPFSIHKPTVTVTDLVFIFEACLPKLVSLPLRKGDQMPWS